MFNNEAQPSLIRNPLVDSLFNVNSVEGSLNPPPPGSTRIITETGNFVLSETGNYLITE